MKSPAGSIGPGSVRVGVFDTQGSALVREETFGSADAVFVSRVAPYLADRAEALSSPILLIRDGALPLEGGLSVHLVTPDGVHVRGSADDLRQQGLPIPLATSGMMITVRGLDGVTIYIDGRSASSDA